MALNDMKSKKRKCDDADWREGHMMEYTALGLRWGAVHPHPEDQASDWWPCVKGRERDVLAVCRQLHPMDWTPFSPSMVYGRDVSQSAKRRVGCSVRDLKSGGQTTILSTVMPHWRFWLASPVNRFMAEGSKQDRIYQLCPSLSLHPLPISSVRPWHGIVSC